MKAKKRNEPSVQSAAHLLDEEIRRVIGNAREEFNRCVMANGRYGLDEFARLVKLFENVTAEKLGEYLDLIDAVRQTHHRCFSCSMKFTAFCFHYCGDRLPLRRDAYKGVYDEAMKRHFCPRDFMKEVAWVIWKAPTRQHQRAMPLP
jgi:hypothetical protein